MINAGESVEKREPFYTAGGNVSWCSHYGKLREVPQKTIKAQSHSDPAIPLLGTHQGKTTAQKGARTHALTAALFTVANTWEQPKCPSTNG